MPESVIIDGETREERYNALLPQLRALTEGETDALANLGNIIAGLRQAMHFFWIGVYFVKGNELVLGPFQGPVACTRIGFGKGVCGIAWKERKTIIVPDVDQFPGHIACSSDSKSEIVLPGFSKQGEPVFILDVDSDTLNDFNEVDEKYLKEVVELISEQIWLNS
jgi:L-methionine (R)-S-oxide reductase